MKLKEHKKLGNELKIAKLIIMDDWVNAKPKTGKRSKRIERIQKLLNKLCDRLDDELFRDFPDEKFNVLVKYYYGMRDIKRNGVGV